MSDRRTHPDRDLDDLLPQWGRSFRASVPEAPPVPDLPGRTRAHRRPLLLLGAGVTSAALVALIALLFGVLPGVPGGPSAPSTPAADPAVTARSEPPTPGPDTAPPPADPGTGAAASTGTTAPGDPPTTAAPTTSTVPSASTPPTATTAPGSGGASPGGAVGGGATARPCPTASLSLSSLGGQGYGGMWYTLYGLTNIGSTTCTLYGYPGVSVVGAQGATVQHPAERGRYGLHAPISELLVTLPPGGVASFLVTSNDTTPNADCPTSFTGVALRVYPPGQTAPLRLDGAQNFCDLGVSPVQRETN